MENNTTTITIRCDADTKETFRIKAFLNGINQGEFLKDLLDIYLEKEMEVNEKKEITA